MRKSVALITFVVACSSSGSKEGSDPEPKNPEAKPAEAKQDPEKVTCEKAPQWRYEKIEFPPEFAPTLPPGVEKLYFAPGMFKPDSPSYWSYVFSIAFDEPGPSDETAMQKFLVDYYGGLIAAVSKGKDVEPPAQPATVVVTANGDGFKAVVNTFDAFTGGAAIEVTLDIALSSDKKCVNVAASPSAAENLWTELMSARECVPCP